jgi:DNA (cytosine-5)-methyltransferase 1
LAFNSIQWTNNLVDISKTKAKDLSIKDTKNYTYLLTYSFPCQNLSLAGKRANLKSCNEINEDNLYDIENRSNMLWQVQRILRELKESGLEMPQVLVMENVKEVHGEGNKKNFNEWLLELERLGYTSYWKDLEATDYGLPQTRVRTFVVSILNSPQGEKYNYVFPKKTPLVLRVKDIKEKNVDDKYYLSQRMVDGMKRTSFESYKFENKLVDENGVASTIIARYDGAPQCFPDKRVIEIGNYSPSGHNASRIIDTRGVAPTITENHGTVCAIKDDIKQEVVKKIIESGLAKEDDIIQHNYTDGGARDIKQMIVSTNGLVPTITTRPDCLGIVVKKEK